MSKFSSNNLQANFSKTIKRKSIWNDSYRRYIKNDIIIMVFLFSYKIIKFRASQQFKGIRWNESGKYYVKIIVLTRFLN